MGFSSIIFNLKEYIGNKTNFCETYNFIIVKIISLKNKTKTKNTASGDLHCCFFLVVSLIFFFFFSEQE